MVCRISNRGRGLSGGMPGVLFPMLAVGEDVQEMDVLWTVDALSAGQEQLWSRAVGLPDETDVLSVEMLPVVQGYPDDGIRLGLDTPSGQLDAAGGNLWKKAAASSVAVSPVTVSSRTDGVWGAAQQLPFSGRRLMGERPRQAGSRRIRWRSLAG